MLIDGPRATRDWLRLILTEPVRAAANAGVIADSLEDFDYDAFWERATPWWGVVDVLRTPGAGEFVMLTTEVSQFGLHIPGMGLVYRPAEPDARIGGQCCVGVIGRPRCERCHSTMRDGRWSVAAARWMCNHCVNGFEAELEASRRPFDAPITPTDPPPQSRVPVRQPQIGEVSDDAQVVFVGDGRWLAARDLRRFGVTSDDIRQWGAQAIARLTTLGAIRPKRK